MWEKSRKDSAKKQIFAANFRHFLPKFCRKFKVLFGMYREFCCLHCPEGSIKHLCIATMIRTPFSRTSSSKTMLAPHGGLFIIVSTFQPLRRTSINNRKNSYVSKTRWQILFLLVVCFSTSSLWFFKGHTLQLLLYILFKMYKLAASQSQLLS